MRDLGIRPVKGLARGKHSHPQVFTWTNVDNISKGKREQKKNKSSESYQHHRLVCFDASADLNALATLL
jgi:hypothetical protein